MDITNNDYDTWKRRTVACLKDPNGIDYSVIWVQIKSSGLYLKSMNDTQLNAFWKRVMAPDYSSDIVSYVDTNLIVAPSQLSTDRAIYVFNIYIYIYLHKIIIHVLI